MPQGFYKETAYWIRSWWLSNISDSDAGKPPLAWPGRPELAAGAPTVFILEAWQPAPASSSMGSNRTINVYTNAQAVRLELNGQPLAPSQGVPFFGQATFRVAYSPGNLTAIAMDHSGQAVGSHSVLTPKAVASIALSLDAPSVHTGTGTHLVADGEDVAMVRCELLDSAGNFAYNATDNITFTVVSGPGRIWTTHNGDPANDNPRDVSWVPAYHGLARAFVRTTLDAATPLWHRQRVRAIDLDSGRGDSVSVSVAAEGEEEAAAGDIILQAEGPGLAPVKLTIPVSTSLAQLPRNVATTSV